MFDFSGADSHFLIHNLKEAVVHQDKISVGMDGSRQDFDLMLRTMQEFLIAPCCGTVQEDFLRDSFARFDVVDGLFDGHIIVVEWSFNIKDRVKLGRGMHLIIEQGDDLTSIVVGDGVGLWFCDLYLKHLLVVFQELDGMLGMELLLFEERDELTDGDGRETCSEITLVFEDDPFVDHFLDLGIEA